MINTKQWFCPILYCFPAAAPGFLGADSLNQLSCALHKLREDVTAASACHPTPIRSSGQPLRLETPYTG